ncbi:MULTISPECIES: cobalamin biosynthesis protein [unclassified Nocardioides]|uniref:cobalamin biosynthesis protein n=1 Tax=unclassified Nocardioides TaxID=2615069 RepID=UPI0009F062F4|nr:MULTISPECIES: cobalamin biosynthesis protein [unclassified Nocardioides]GAW50483.1 cobalamin biosynthesis transmembrane protein CobD [Nocardioides sp. PD653-B2]GAW53922.1 cobalamin biosynthesis transmembrane protein CobD [Nocardioides sp. PD653]
MTSLGLILGYAADAVLGDPRRFHPVAGFGRTAAALERVTYADRRGAGVVHVAVLVGGAAALGTRGIPTALATWAVLGARSLDREAAAVEALLGSGDLPGARHRLTHLVGRDTGALDESEVARAVIESLAENTSDAVVAPLVWGAVAGVPGLLGHRAANTLDAMVGHRNARYERFGWAAARLDDVLNLPGSRLTALLTVGLADDPGAAWRTWRRDAAGHPSPNAGPVEAAFAGALGVRLGGVNTYGDRVEDRHVLGDGRAPTLHDITRARRLARRVGWGALAAVVPIALLRRRR